MAEKSEKSTKSKKMGRPAAPIHFAPGVVDNSKKKRVNTSMFRSRESLEKWMRQRFAVSVENVEYMIEQLRQDLAANATAMQAFADQGLPTPVELLRARQSITTSLRTYVAGQQEMMLKLAKSYGLMSDLGDGEDGGNDYVINIQRTPPPRQKPTEAAPDGPEE